MALPPNPALRRRHFTLRLPFLLWAGRRLYRFRSATFDPAAIHAPAPRLLRRVCCFLWLWHLSVAWRAEPLLPSGTVRGWQLDLSTPFAALTLYWKHPTWDWNAPLQTSLHLRYSPMWWRNPADGALLFRREWQRVWSRWEVRGRLVLTAEGATRETWLERILPKQPQPTNPLWYQGD